MRLTSHEPMPRTATTSMASPVRFLSFRAASASSEGSRSEQVGSPCARSKASMRPASSAGHQPRAAQARDMIAVPAATAWPCGTA